MKSARKRLSASIRSATACSRWSTSLTLDARRGASAIRSDNTLRFDLPDVDPENVDLSVENNTLTVTASRRAEEAEGVNWLLRERPTGHHSRQIRLSDSLDTSKVEAKYDNGVLTVTVPMREESKPRRVSIQASNREAISAGVGS